MINTMTNSNQKKPCEKCKNKQKQTLTEFFSKPQQIFLFAFTFYLFYCGVKETVDMIQWLVN
jgi:hypothetical protein